MAAELNMHQTQASEYKCKIEQLSAGIEEVKGQWFARKRREHVDAAGKAPIAVAVCCGEGSPRVLGGGFHITAAV